MLVRYVLGSYNEDPSLALGPSPLATNEHMSSTAPRSSTSSSGPDYNLLGTGNTRRLAVRGVPRDDISIPSHLSMNQPGNRTSPTNPFDGSREPSPSKSAELSPVDRQGPADNLARKVLDKGQQQAGVTDSIPLSSSLPTTSSPLDDVNRLLAGMRPSSELGQYTDGRNHHMEQRRQDNPGDASSFFDAIASVPRVSIQSADHRAPSPEKVEANAKAKISGPIGGVPIPAGYKFGGKDTSADPAASTAFERREKAKSRLFWGFGRPNGDD